MEAFFTFFFSNKNEVFGGEQEKESLCVTIKLSRNMGFPTCRRPNLKLICATSKGSYQHVHTRSLIGAFASR